MKQMNKRCYDGIVVFDRPLPMEDNVKVYGMLINIQDEKDNIKSGQQISRYISYLLSVSQFIRKGRIEDDNKWVLPDHKINITYNIALRRFLEVILADLIEYRIIHSKGPIEYLESEIGNKCLIINRDIIDRYDRPEASYTNKPEIE